MNIKTPFALLLSLVCLISPALSQIQAGNSVIIKIMGVPAEEKAKIDETYPVSKGGTVNLPFIGEIRAAGLESDQLAKSIQTAYREGGIYNDATIQVLSNDGEVKVVDQIVHIGGFARAPGPRPFRKGLTVFQAIQAAGGATEFGALNRVILWRVGKPQIIDLRTPAGKSVVTIPDDTIEIPEKNIWGL